MVDGFIEVHHGYDQPHGVLVELAPRNPRKDPVSDFCQTEGRCIPEEVFKFLSQGQVDDVVRFCPDDDDVNAPRLGDHDVADFNPRLNVGGGVLILAAVLNPGFVPRFDPLHRDLQNRGGAEAGGVKWPELDIESVVRQKAVDHGVVARSDGFHLVNDGIVDRWLVKIFEKGPMNDVVRVGGSPPDVVAEERLFGRLQAADHRVPTLGCRWGFNLVCRERGEGRKRRENGEKHDASEHSVAPKKCHPCINRLK